MVLVFCLLSDGDPRQDDLQGRLVGGAHNLLYWESLLTIAASFGPDSRPLIRRILEILAVDFNFNQNDSESTGVSLDKHLVAALWYRLKREDLIPFERLNTFHGWLEVLRWLDPGTPAARLITARLEMLGDFECWSGTYLRLFGGSEWLLRQHGLADLSLSRLGELGRFESLFRLLIVLDNKSCRAFWHDNSERSGFLRFLIRQARGCDELGLIVEKCGPGSADLEYSLKVMAECAVTFKDWHLVLTSCNHEGSIVSHAFEQLEQLAFQIGDLYTLVEVLRDPQWSSELKADQRIPSIIDEMREKAKTYGDYRLVYLCTMDSWDIDQMIRLASTEELHDMVMSEDPKLKAPVLAKILELDRADPDDQPEAEQSTEDQPTSD
ncbi:hypothetical protein COY93_04705 [Candidatus Uhrbacteria bacterium CG_4_10_14_0_8_um_filter_58_22]|uniref:Uncharacterized protein n=1 Tax=Candidatus Uhrbacteria bacterium CG_4_10_14_0_8_um_filter_58_22 TaxID=1975029 RepID=A0A2M7QA26_9BACT|nr:MAG: hypothetical protein COY93_04705 [Candidatus Uhrbacteria bacterium CG_4_10_14_0_8_um_filter_58_22]